MHLESPAPDAVRENVRAALAEDIGSGDVTAMLVAAGTLARARIVTREHAVLCGQPWVSEVFRQIDPRVRIEWLRGDGETVSADEVLLELEGPARSLLTGERTALNFLQLLSGTATRCHRYAGVVAGLPVKLLDTRKTIPGLRIAQKYAVRCGGCHNHRIGLFDAFLIKENHIAACGSIANAVRTARDSAPGRPVEVEVENLAQLGQALEAGADSVLLDNFTESALREAVAITAGRAPLEASGGVSENTLRAIAETGVDYISIGALTKDCQAIDLSMRMIA
ncbi:MAG: carboxylating nicotinate-nucleotide diphosphorylase [Pseudomonadales bacterium]|nr:carboxylating nicotinate-nucleotide diphosphorylase [Gammaproteobacteria bacterium]MBK9665332.1 carboxylating nicotinate-nucleotide diphosphorylase [Gammaproteobacteria bacterium]MBP6053009.1 carboxylating nicotinate-nucleotide diphosphorylase [Pseudomonadales bacterium]MBP6227365.1 carboxylating nicotinate-nucleotide diphosphorylase [Pseudomonadales bacterium]